MNYKKITIHCAETINRMPLDVLAVMDNAADSLSLSVNPRDGSELREARAAVAELVEAASDIPVEYDFHGEPASPELARFVAALAKFGGAS